MSGRLLSEVASLDYGCAFDSKKFNSDGAGLPLVRIRDVDRGYSNTYFDGEYDSKYLVHDGDLLIGMDGNFTISRWKGGEALLNQRVCRVRPKEGCVSGEYLRFFLSSELARIEARTPFATVKHLSAKVLAEIRVPGINLDQQSRIAKILGLVESALTMVKGALETANELRLSIYDSDFGKMDWPRKRLDEVTECLDSKRRPVTASNRPEGNVAYFGANGQQGWIDEAIFDETLVLVAEDGGHFDAPERGVAYKVTGPSWVNNHAHVLRAGPEITAEFLHQTLKHFNFMPYISGSTRAKLNKGQLNQVEIPIPPLDIQEAFGNRVESVEMLSIRLASIGSDLSELLDEQMFVHFTGGTN